MTDPGHDPPVRRRAPSDPRDPRPVAELLLRWRPDPEIRSLRYLAEGDFCRAWLLNGRQVVRVPKHREAARALAREACLLAALAPRLGGTVPRPTHVAATSPAGWPFSVHERVPGRPLTRESWRGLPGTDRDRLARDVGGFLERLHGVGTGMGRSCGLKELDPRGEVQRLRARLRGEPAAPLPVGLARTLDRCFRAYLAEGGARARRPALLHADLSPGHVLFDPGRREITGVIDWGDAVIGDPARDFIFLYEDWGRDFLELALEGYGLEEGGRLLPRVRVSYLADQLEWTLRAGEEGRGKDLEHGIAALEDAVRDLRRDFGRSASGPDRDPASAGPGAADGDGVTP